MSSHRRKWSKSEKLSALSMLKKEGLTSTCKYFTVSQTTLYKWKHRFEALGESAFDPKNKSGLNTDMQKLIEENKQLKQLVADKELKLMIQEDLLKKSHYC